MKYLMSPFVLLGDLLRKLSLSGTVGNVIAIVLYSLISLIPCFIYLWMKKKNKVQKVDYLLPLISIYVFIMLYYLVNPTLAMANAVTASSEMGSYMFIALFFSIVFGYIVLKGIIFCTSNNEKGLQKGICFLLYVMIGILAVVIVCEFAVNLPEAIKVLREGNTMVNDLEMTIVFLVLQKIVVVIPQIFEIVIIIMLTIFIKEFVKDSYSKNGIRLLEQIGNLCMKMLKVTVAANVGYNLLQMIMRNRLYQINIDTTVPVFSMVLILGLFIITKYMRESQKLKEENDMFI